MHPTATAVTNHHDRRREEALARKGDRLISTKELADLHNCHPKTIGRRRKKDPTFPKPVVMNSQLHQWWESDALAHLASKQVVA
jgi:predicted DNA-binding transcriptional regulator AlpA